MTFPDFLKIAVLPIRNLLEFNTSQENNLRFSGGVEAGFIQVLSNSLEFEYQLLVPEDGEWGRLEADGTWNGMIGMVHRGEADLAIGHLTITQSRRNVVDFLPYAIEENTFATNLNNRFLSKPSFYLAPFQLHVWISCLLVLCLMPLVFRFLMEKKVPIRKLYLSMFGIFFSHPLTFSITDIKDKILLLTWFIFALILSSSYRSILLSSLTVPLPDYGVRTIQELASAITAGKFRATTSLGSVDKELLKTSEDEALKIIGEHIIEEEWMSNNIVEAPKIKPSTAVLGPRFHFLLQYGEAPFTTKLLFKETVSFWIVGLAVRKNFCCKKELASHIGGVVSNGIYQKVYQDELYKAQLNVMSIKEGRLVEARGLSMFDLSELRRFSKEGSILEIATLSSVSKFSRDLYFVFNGAEEENAVLQWKDICAVSEVFWSTQVNRSTHCWVFAVFNTTTTHQIDGTRTKIWRSIQCAFRVHGRSGSAQHRGYEEAFSKNEFLGRPPQSAFSLFGTKSEFQEAILLIWGSVKRQLKDTYRKKSVGFLQAIESHNGQPFPIYKYLTPSLSNNICSIIFGKRYSYDDPERQDLDFNLDAVIKCMAQTAVHIFFPWIKHVPFLLRFFDFETGVKAYKYTKDLVERKIQEHKETLEPESIRDLIDGYLIEMDRKSKEDPNTTFTEEILTETVLDTFGAGSESVRTSISWCIYTMAAYPEVQRKVHCEI
ncbi:hypothetical protein JTE90_015105 [Oedothorax gibbosus]|uniref:Ionotropic glutamate receptor L-glutamate and glycine-binding domain-containing protein n=1 Tax=Oedothorax gibbosus TaxID=931172 RepID=A0AAV6VS44_9ARAC|nr:hypothetical protein JTE90_015105 [Oedothorax gibbosus]